MRMVLQEYPCVEDQASMIKDKSGNYSVTIKI